MADGDEALNFGIDLEEVRQRADAMGYFLSVTDVLEASEALDEDQGLAGIPPQAFVGVLRETAEPIKLIGGFAQRVTVDISILFVESAARMDRKSRDQLERVRKAVIRQFLAWKPERAEKGLEYLQYRVVSIGNGLAWGEVTFRTTFRLSTDT